MPRRGVPAWGKPPAAGVQTLPGFVMTIRLKINQLNRISRNFLAHGTSRSITRRLPIEKVVSNGKQTAR